MTGLDAYDFIGRHLIVGEFEFEVTEEWANYIQPGIDWVRDQGGELFVETRVKLDRWMPGQFGTLDTGIITKKWIIINDFKFGEGVPVSVEENEQLLIYALGFWDQIARHRTKAKRFLIVIDQPRVKGGWQVWEIHLDDLLAFGEKVRKAAERTYDPRAKFKPGPIQCDFCPAARQNKCEAYTEFCLDVVGIGLGDLENSKLRLGDPETLTLEQRSWIVKHTPMIRKFLSRVHADTLSDALQGNPTPGLKAVKGRRGPRHWISKVEAKKKLKKLLGENAFTQKLITPAKAEELLDADEMKLLKNFIGQSDGEPSLVPVEAKGEAITPNRIEFDDFDR